MFNMNRRQFIGSSTILGLAGLTQSAAGEAAAKDNNPKENNLPPLPFVPGSWSIAVLPDTQNYATFYPGMFHLQTQWLVDNKDKYNIKYALQLGDVTNRNSEIEWQRASAAMAKLDNTLPYAIVPGNHDYAKGGASDDRTTTLINDYFPPSRFTKWPTFGGVMEEGRIENNYHTFEVAGQNWLVVGLEWGPRDHVLQWANEIIKKYNTHKAIIITHAYLYSDSTRYDWAVYGDTQHWNPHNYHESYKNGGVVNDGQQMWDKLVKANKNVVFVINGHVLNDGLGYLLSKGENGNQVHQMLVNYQMRPVGGESRLRLLEFLPDGKTVQVKSCCPLLETYETDPESQFVIKL